MAMENEPGKMLVDFSPKGGPKDLLGKYVYCILIHVYSFDLLSMWVGK